MSGNAALFLRLFMHSCGNLVPVLPSNFSLPRRAVTSAKAGAFSTLPPGKSTKVTVEVPAERLRNWDTRKKPYVVETGNYQLLIGAASDNIRLNCH